MQSPSTRLKEVEMTAMKSKRFILNRAKTFFVILLVTCTVYSFVSVTSLSNILPATNVSENQLAESPLSYENTQGQRNETDSNTGWNVTRISSTDSPTTSLSNKKLRIAYATLSYGDFICSALTATHQFHTIISQQSAYAANTDIVIMRLGAPILSQFLPQGVQQRPIQETAVKGRASNWIHTFAKFWIATWYEYDVVVFLDADVLLYKPLDNLVDHILSLPEGSMTAPRAYWLRQQPTATTGTFLIRPTNRTVHGDSVADSSTDRVAVTKRLEALLTSSEESRKAMEEAKVGERQWFNDHLVNDITLVDGIYTLLVGEFYPKDGAYQKNGLERNVTPTQLLDEEAPLVHFVSRWKPWKKGIGMAKKSRDSSITENIRRLECSLGPSMPQQSICSSVQVDDS